MKETTINEIERINIIILVIGSLLSILIMRDFKYLFSFAVASAIMTLNFRLLKKVIEGWFLKPDINKKKVLIALPLKFLALAGLIAIIVVYGDINAIFFLIGLSTVFVSIVINQVAHLLNPVEKRGQNGT